MKTKGYGVDTPEKFPPSISEVVDSWLVKYGYEEGLIAWSLHIMVVEVYGSWKFIILYFKEESDLNNVLAACPVVFHHENIHRVHLTVGTVIDSYAIDTGFPRKYKLDL